MAKKREPDKLARDMIQCVKDGYGCHYGKWKAMQEHVEIEKPTAQENWRVCPWCGKPFKLKTKKEKIYCEANCQLAAQTERYRQKRREARDGK